MSERTDRELLELAAVAAGLEIHHWADDKAAVPYTPEESAERNGVDGYMWNPLTDDGDALRLAVKLHIRIEPITGRVRAFTGKTLAHAAIQAHEPYRADPYAATRRAIVRAAAATGAKP